MRRGLAGPSRLFWRSASARLGLDRRWAFFPGPAAAQDSVSFSKDLRRKIESGARGLLLSEAADPGALRLQRDHPAGKRQGPPPGLRHRHDQAAARRKYAPGFAIFAKGDQSEKLIIVGMIDGQLNTVYRARALLAAADGGRALDAVLPAEHPAGRERPSSIS